MLATKSRCRVATVAYQPAMANPANRTQIVIKIANGAQRTAESQCVGFRL